MEFNVFGNDRGLGKMYRVRERWIGTWDPDTERLLGSRVEFYVEAYPIIKLTPKGKWIEYHGRDSLSDKRFILNEAGKRFAHETKEGALKAYQARRKRQIAILSGQLERAKTALAMANFVDVEKLCCY